MTSGRGVTLEEQAKTIAKVFASNPDKQSEIKYDPSVNNNTPSFLFSIKKAHDDFGYTPEYADFEIMMRDYKKDIEDGKYIDLFKYDKIV